MTDQYYEILSVDKNATLSDIKKAYRKRAKFLHPDVNKSPDAHEKFILLNEAYEYLQNFKTGKIYDLKKRAYTKQRTQYKTYKEWKQTESEKARERARKHAEMEYEAYTNTEFYKTTVALNTIVDFLSVLTVIFIFSTPLIGYLLKGVGGLFGGLLIIFMLVHYWTDILIHHKPELNFKELGSSILRLTNKQTFQLVILIIFNLFLICRVGLSTLVPFRDLIVTFVIMMGLGYFIARKLTNKFMKRLVVFAIAPGFINLFFLLNFLMSSNETIETYNFKHLHHSRRNKTTKIILQGDKYSDFIGIRIFLDFEAMENSHTIAYKFADGLFGFRVMKSYEFK